MGITVTNKSSKKIEASINKWGSDGDTKFFGIDSGKQESWDRSDDRGFVLSLKRNGTQAPYYVQATSKIEIENSAVKDHGETIHPVA
uniref:IPD072Dc n=1 Tax=Pseudomonas ficuserectae TaxID=53410 RepID=A0A1C8FLS2_9PSED|nr:IPD072Dc [Pseudomonas ficuserectae]